MKRAYECRDYRIQYWKHLGISCLPWSFISSRNYSLKSFVAWHSKTWELSIPLLHFPSYFSLRFSLHFFALLLCLKHPFHLSLNVYFLYMLCPRKLCLKTTGWLKCLTLQTRGLLIYSFTENLMLDCNHTLCLKDNTCTWA